MLITLALLAAIQAAPDGQQPVFHGRAGELTVPIPRRNAPVTVDGVLDEPVWREAPLLTGFSQYQPADGIPAVDSTEVLVWYAPHGIYFGIRAFEAHGLVNATLADRDNIETDDYVQILLDTYNDHRRAFVFGVNPLGVQADGIQSEGTFGAAAGPGAGGHFESVDLNPDFVYQSHGHLTDWGYEVEVYVPFKSIRYQAVDPQDWAINIVRKVQHSGYKDTWTPVRRANASFLTQSGTLVGLTGLERGLVLDMNPFATGKALGAPGADGWDYDASPEVGLNVRWGATANLTLDGTVNPDFSQVEADVGQVTVNERFAVYFPEKRPFFLEGIEQFDTPNQLIYMRRIRNPVGGAKLTGKLGRTNIGMLSAVDHRAASATGDDYPVFNIVRLRHDLGGNSTAGLSYTDRIAGSDYNRVASADVRAVFAKIYWAQVQLAESFTREGGSSRTGPLWELTADRTGRNWGFHYTVKGTHPDFAAQSGFVPRTGTVAPSLTNRLTAYGTRGSLFEQWTAYFSAQGVWNYDDFFDAASPLETSVNARNSATLRGGWNVGVSPKWETAAFDPTFYASYYVATVAGDTIPFAIPNRINNAYGIDVSVSTPQFPAFAATLGAGLGKAIAFYEPARANARSVSATATWRPTDKARIELRYAHQRLSRERDGSTLSTANIPRIKIEYQLSRPIFVRFVGQYNAQTRDALRDPRTGEPIVYADSSGFSPAAVATSNDLRVDWLFSFRPNPGTVVFLGYGASLTEPDAFRFRDLGRVNDGFFVKVSYLFRL